ncbi:MAG: LacI family DNA-binding transcriptional regulator [Fimbriimonas sp.]|nr:LacI family DNA-binding transcriptional regulator [Fimbriimonas sp.]
MRTNIRQVAALAGVSRTTVSNVLLGKEGRITSAKREEVLRAVEQLGYLPVRSSLQNRNGETRVLALALHDPLLARSEFHSQVYAGICQAALENDYDVLTVLRSAPDWAVNRSAVRLLDRRSDGILFFQSDEDNSATLKALALHGIPVVACYQRDVPDGIAWVDPDNHAAIHGLVELLVDSGHTRIAHLTYKVEHQFDFRERKRAFIDSIEQADLPRLAGGIVETLNTVTIEVAEQLVATGATAIVCGNDFLAMQLWDLLDSMGLRVPEDISLTGIDNQMPSVHRGLTTMEFSYAKVGVLAVEALISRISGKSAEECCFEVAPQLRERTSVRQL